jgi:hypothetical protein
MYIFIYIYVYVFPVLFRRILTVNSKEKYFLSWPCLSACSSAAPTGRVFRKFYSGTLTKICRETPNLANIGHQCRAPWVKALVLLYCWQQYEIFCSSTTVQSAFLRLHANTKRFDTLFYIATCRPPTIPRENIVALPRWQWLREPVKMLCYTYIACLANILL